MAELSMSEVPTHVVFHSSIKKEDLFDEESETMYDAPWVFPDDFESERSYEDDSELIIEEVREVKTTEPIVFDSDLIGEVPWLEEDFSPYTDGKTGVTMDDFVKAGLMVKNLDNDHSERSITSWRGFIMEKMANKSMMCVPSKTRPVKTRPIKTRPVKTRFANTLKDHSERSCTSCTQDLTMNDDSSIGGLDTSPLIECIRLDDTAVQPIPEEKPATEPCSLLGDPSKCHKALNETLEVCVKARKWQMREPSADDPDPWLSAYMTKEDVEDCKKIEKEGLKIAPGIHTEDPEPAKHPPIKITKEEAEQIVLDAPWTSSVDLVSNK